MWYFILYSIFKLFNQLILSLLLFYFKFNFVRFFNQKIAFVTISSKKCSNLIKRIQQHKSKIAEGFTKKYSVDKLVYYEQTEDVYSALNREKALKKWNREWKLNLIEKENPNWKDLYFNIIK